MLRRFVSRSMSGPELSARSAGAVSPVQIQASGSSSLTLNATEAKRRTTQDKKHLKRALSTIEKDSLRYKSNLLKPWLDENGQVIWPQSRIRVAKIVLSQSFETVMGLIISANVVIMIFETDADATCHRPPSGTVADPSYSMSTCTSQSSSILWLSIVNYLLLTIYTVECALRAFVERGAYPWNRWNQIDLLTVVSGWGSALLASTLPINVLRILRLIRLVRAARVVISVPEFYILVSGFTSSFKAILFGSVMLVCIIVVWSIIVVEVIHPVNVGLDYPASCDNCHAKFKSVWSAMLTIFQQVVAGDSWGETSLPLVEAEPLTILILFPIMMTISLGAMNLILAVIVERATEARENDQVDD
ncbi:CAC [Symbiodinium sp. CCMP2592]|nr:CAC [Symbiodinium sp. CCMP2592]